MISNTSAIFTQLIFSSTFSLSHDFLRGKAGLRNEYTTNRIQEGSGPPYRSLTPSFVLLHKLDEIQSIKHSYSYCTQPPDYGELDPYYNIADPHNILTGNPQLKPEEGNNYEMGYYNNSRQGSVFVSTFYSHITDDLQSFTTYYDIYK
jgi:ferric enterobactin receptor